MFGFLVIACILVLGEQVQGAPRKIRLITLHRNLGKADYIHICRRSDPNVAKCVRESVEALRPRLKNGIPELNVPSIDPFFIKEIVIARGDDSSNFRAFLRNVHVEGPSNFEIKKIKVSVDKNIYRVDVTFPLLKLRGEYDVDAKILVVPIKGHGTFNANVTNAEGHGVLKAEVFNKDGYNQSRFTSFNFKIKMDDYSVHLDNLFNGDKILSKAANDVLNDNNKEFINGALPFIQAKTSEILLEAANTITANLDYDKVFPL